MKSNDRTATSAEDVNRLSLRELCQRVHEAANSDATIFDSPLTELAIAWIGCAPQVQQLLELLRELDSYSHFEVTGCESDARYVQLKQRAHALASQLS